MKSYKELIVWQKSIDLVMMIYKTTKSFPKEEQYTLTSQMRRSAISIPSNIAEGYARKSRKEYRQFLQIAFGSGSELETQLYIAHKLRYLSKHNYKVCVELLIEIQKMLNTMLKKLNLTHSG